jgi:NAD(P)-dependent dehydrogenase (short-subunit alcohol dehydrogenase family)
MDLKNKVAIVTGGGSGLGEATAIKLAEGGAKVAVLDLNADAANAVAKRVGGRAFAIDIADAEAGETTVATIASDLGTPRILVNCAGVGTPMKILGKDGPVSLAAFEKVVRINLIGTFNIMRLVADVISRDQEPGDGKQTQGVIINTASVAAFDGQIGQPLFCVQGGGGGHGASRRARACAFRHPSSDDRAGDLLDPDAQDPSRRGVRIARPLCSLSSTLGRTRGVREARAPHDRQRHAERRGRPHRRIDPHGPEIGHEQGHHQLRDQGPSMSPHLPVTPEIAESTVEAAEVGAAIVPLYARNPDDSRPLATLDEARDILKLKGGDKVGF